MTRSITKTSSAIAAPAAGAAALLAIGAATGGVGPELGSLPGPGTPGLRGASVEHHQHGARADAAGAPQTASAPPAPAQSAAPAPGPRAPVHPRPAVALPIRPNRVTRHRAEAHRAPRRTLSSTPVGERHPQAPAPTTPTTRPQPYPHGHVGSGGAGLPTAPPAQQPAAETQPQSPPASDPQGDRTPATQPPTDQSQGSADPRSTGDSSTTDNS
ncbi:MAG: hypothetical protein ACXVUE_05050 [Solirubrobacteraceae bacterium]